MLYFIANYEVAGTTPAKLNDLKKWLLKNKLRAVDCETAMSEWVEDRIPISYQFGNKKDQWVIDRRDVSIESLKSLLQDEKSTNILHNCLPEDTEVLTENGWKNIKNITTQDIVFGYKDDKVLKQKVLNIINKKDEIWELKNSGKSLRSTPQHRWLTKNKKGKIGYKVTKNLAGSLNKIILNGNYENKNTLEVFTDHELTLFTWGITDGHIKIVNGKIKHIAITQNENKFANEIKEVLNKLNYEYNIYEFGELKKCFRFTINQLKANELLSKIGYTANFDFVKFVLQLNPKQLDIFIDVFNKAEGYTKLSQYNRKGYVIAKEKSDLDNKRDAIALALYLKGYTVSFNKATVNSKTSKIADCRTLKVIKEVVQDVYCLETEFSNFVIRQKECIFLTGNCKFDYQILKHHENITLESVWDTMLGEQILSTGIDRPKGYFTLEQTHYRYYDSNPYGDQASLFDPYIPKRTRNEISKKTTEPLTLGEIYYAAMDLITAHKIYERQKQILNENQLLETAKLENEFVLVLGDMELNGMPIDQTEWLRLSEWSTTKLKEQESILQKMYPGIANWNSHVQVKKLFKQLGIPIKYQDKESIAETVIKEFKDDYPIISEFLKYKRYQKLSSTYGIKFLDHVNPHTSRIHSSYMQIMSTGRTSSTNPNLQNLPTEKEGFAEGKWWKEAFRTSDNFIIADYSLITQILIVL